MGLEGYEPGDVIARSPRTVVRRAQRKSDQLPVVIKALAKEYPPAHEVDQLESEYEILRKVSTTGVIRAYAIERDGNGVALVLEDIGGRDVIEPGAHTPLPLEQLFAVAATVTGAVGVLHGCGIIHKDVKPANIVVNQQTGEIRLIDFNISSDLSTDVDAEKAGEQLEGSLPYISPEQTGRMNRQLDFRTDYYSLGVTLFELATGALPFTAADMMGWVHCHMSHAIPDARALNPAVPESLADIIRKLMAKSPDDRYQSAHGLLRDLARCRDEWRASGASPRFPLGEHDVSERFLIPSRIYGRNGEATALRAALAAATNGPAALLLVSGPAGIGKSALIEVVHQEALRGFGGDAQTTGGGLSAWVAIAEHGSPYGALGQALRALVSQLLAERDDRLEERRRVLSAAIAPNGQVLVDLVPELERVVGPQPAVPALPPEDAHPRFRHAFSQLVKALARPAEPLVLVLDGLQSADRSSVELLMHLLADPELRHVAVLGGWRTNDDAPASFLAAAIADLERGRPRSVSRVELPALGAADINQLLTATLHRDARETQTLAATIRDKTAGNPFFVHELLNMLHHDGAFRFDAEQGRWSWQAGEIERAALTDNVVDLMASRLKRLPPESLRATCLAACLGSPFDVDTLAELSAQPVTEVVSALRPAVQGGTLLPVPGGRLRFQHARLEQTAASLLDGDERARWHLLIGERLLRQAGPAAADGERVFEIVGHLNRGRVLMTDLERRKRLAELNFAAGQRAHRATAYAGATAHFEIALDVLTSAEWAQRPALWFDCRRAHVECVFLSGEIERAEGMAEALTTSAPDNVAAGLAFYLWARIIEHQARFSDVIERIRAGLRLLGVELPVDPAQIQAGIGQGIGRMQAHLARTPIEDLVHLPPMTDREKAMAMRLLFQLIPSAIQTYPPLFLLAELMMFDLTVTHGITAASCKNFMDCGIIQGGILGDYHGAYRLAQVAFAILERYRPTPLEAGLNFVFAHFVSPWRAPYRESLQAFQRAQQIGKQMGNLSHRIYACAIEPLRLLLIGQQLDECHAHTEAAAAYLTQVRAVGPLQAVEFVQRALARLRAKDDMPPATSDDDFMARMVRGKNAQYLFSAAQILAMVSYLLGDVDAAARWDAFIVPYLPAGTSLFALADLALFQTLTLVKRWPLLSTAEQDAAAPVLDANLEKLAKWSASCPENFAHKHKLAAAEVARLRRAPLDLMVTLYDEATTAAGDDFPHMRALASELQGEMWLERKQRRVARAFLQEAHYLYQRWGARAKVRQLEQRFPDWLITPGAPRDAHSTTFARHTITVDTLHGVSLDMASAVKAMQAVSSEVTQDRLYARLMATIIENAGAQRGCLLIRNDAGELEVAASAGLDGQSRSEGAGRRIEDATDLCPDVVRYVARTLDAVVLDDARNHDRYNKDGYIRSNQIRSVLCLPVLHQGKLLGVLYAENNAVTHAFTAGRLDLLRIIASQAAISITNARLYESLEEKVVDRTRELADKNREVAVMLDSLQQGIFTLDDQLAIQPQYSRHLEEIVGRRELAGADGLDLLFAGTDMSADQVATARAALLLSFGAESFLADINGRHLVRKLRRQAPGDTPKHLEIDWSWLVDDHDVVDRVLVTVRDVTAMEQLALTVRAAARELDIVGQILDAGLESFEGFCRSSRALLAEMQATLTRAAPVEISAVQQLFRNLHTIKGNARMLGFGHIVELAHRAEDQCAAVPGAGAESDAVDRSLLLAHAGDLLAALEAHEEIYERKVGNLIARQSQRLRRTLADVSAAVRAAAEGASDPARALAEIDRAMQRSSAAPIGELVREASRMLPDLARELGKPEPLVDCEDAGLMLAESFSQVLREVMVHAFRNALDHGLEGAAERGEARKPRAGRITVRPSREDARLIIRLADDGRGLSLAGLRARTGGTQDTDDEIAERAFQPGVSTTAAVTTISGRGVGLDAVRSFMRAHGGDARIAFTGPATGGHRPFELVLELPGLALAD